MILHEKTIRCKYEEFLREKKMLDDIIQRIHEEDERALEEKLCKMQRTREEMMAFKAAQEVWKKRERDALEEENRKIQEYLQSKEGSLRARQEEKERREAIKQKISDDMARKIAEDEVNNFYFLAEDFIYTFPVLCVNVVMNACTANRDGRHFPNTSSIIGSFSTVCL